ncbi:MAG: hypothetical protein JNK92_03740 [Dechloromonas sp.]|nr:hypothetical protein [Dechloromonas sp.]
MAGFFIPGWNLYWRPHFMATGFLRHCLPKPSWQRLNLARFERRANSPCDAGSSDQSIVGTTVHRPGNARQYNLTAVSKYQVRRISITSKSRASAGWNGRLGVWL